MTLDRSEATRLLATDKATTKRNRDTATDWIYATIKKESDDDERARFGSYEAGVLLYCGVGSAASDCISVRSSVFGLCSSSLDPGGYLSPLISVESTACQQHLFKSEWVVI